MEVNTVKVKSTETALGYMIINESDFNPGTMERWYAPGEEPLKSPEPVAEDEHEDVSESVRRRPSRG